MKNYILKCSHPECGKEYDDDSLFRLKCDAEISGEHGPSLLKPVYYSKQLKIRAELPGIFKYIDWLPVYYHYLNPTDFVLGRPVVYKSSGLSNRLGLKNLYVAFSGYWPERGGTLLTRTFKEFEAQATFARYLSVNKKSPPFPLIIASAGNSGNAYNLLSYLLDIPLYLVIPETGLDKLMLPFETNPFLILVRGDYSDAIDLADRISEHTNLARDGGVRNVARRAGLGVVMLHAVTHPQEGAGHLFDHYFQAVGSGTGAIAAWEAIELLLTDGRFGDTITKIHVAQNSPFTPIVDSWLKQQRELIKIPGEEAKEKISAVTAHVLTNRYPAYSINGGLFDVLSASNGKAWKVNNYQLFHAARMFRETEGIDIGPAAAVAVGALIQAIKVDEVNPDDKILLHITGGGKEIQYSKGPVYTPKPSIIVYPDEIDRVIKEIRLPVRITNCQDILKYLEDGTQ